MVKLEPQHEKVPDVILVRAYDFGNLTLNLGLYKNELAIKDKAGFWYLEARMNGNLCFVKILDFTANFLCHPRTGEIKNLPYTNNLMEQFYLLGVDGGGFRLNEDGTWGEIFNRDLYPLRDNDKGTFSIRVDDLFAQWTTDENYGNMWWMNTEGVVLSWKATPNRHFPIPSSLNFTGLAQLENTVNDIPYYTYFGRSIYQDGNILVDGPGESLKTLVAGACIINNVLICIVVTDKGNGYYLQCWKYVEEAWKQFGPEYLTTRISTSAFISTDGLLFAFDKNIYEINNDLTTYSLKILASVPSGVQRETPAIDNGFWFDGDFSKEGYLPLWVEPTKTLETTVTASFNTKSLSNSGETTLSIPVVTAGVTTTPTVSVQSSYVMGDYTYEQFQINDGGVFCSASWSGGGRYTKVDDFGLFKYKTTCTNGGSVTVTLNPMGLSGTYTVAGTPVTITVSITGSGTEGRLTTGDTASASGGTAPYSWTITGGSIDSSGVVTTGGCGTVTITATDDCGNIGTTQAKMPTGTWLLKTPACVLINNQDCGPPLEYNLLDGVFKYDVRWSLSNRISDGSPPLGFARPVSSTCGELGTQFICPTQTNYYAKKYIIAIYEWVCP